LYESTGEKELEKPSLLEEQWRKDVSRVGKIGGASSRKGRRFVARD
jgi:hypothetical protein